MIQRLRVTVRGLVQGVGFRPFIHRLATSLKLTGWVLNSAEGVTLEAEGSGETLQMFLVRLRSERPPRSAIHGVESVWLDPVGLTGFEIRESSSESEEVPIIPPDIATCDDCLREMLDPQNRRFQYPFTNCTNCGPRFTIIQAMPYDRQYTSMHRFEMCEDCRREYTDAENRRFHAEPNACPLCGPKLQLLDARGQPVECDDPLSTAGAELRRGGIIGVKSLGGFHLMVLAGNQQAVERLRKLKHRDEKPFAVMFLDIAQIRKEVNVSEAEESLLSSPEAPIVLLERAKVASRVAPGVAPGNPFLGCMVPYTPVHHLLLRDIGEPVVATSGNLADETVCTGTPEALNRLGGIADMFLTHDRQIVRHADDSVVRVVANRISVLRRARGFTPLPINLSRPLPPANNILATGAHLKNTIALARGKRVFISQHIGNLETEHSFSTFESVIGDLSSLLHAPPTLVVTDLHPDYLSTRYGVKLASEHSQVGQESVQHHFAHCLSCMAENELEPPVLGVAWDGTGFGLDGSIWGGEFFLITENGSRRIAHFRQFRLPGGEAAIREPRRAGLGMLFEYLGKEAFGRRDLAPVAAFTSAELGPLKTILTRRFNSHLCSSVGRLFDGVASLCGIRQRNCYEGQAAMELEYAARGAESTRSYPIHLKVSNRTSEPGVVDWEPTLHALMAELSSKTAVAEIASAFHSTLVDSILLVAQSAGLQRVVLTGGCFQNRLLTETAVRRLQSQGFIPYWHQRVPPNDGGISLGQVIGTRPELRLQG